jgi:hypothetical protein
MDTTSLKLRTLEEVLRSRTCDLRNAHAGIVLRQHEAEGEYRELVILRLQTDVEHAQSLLEKIKATGNSIPYTPTGRTPSEIGLEHVLIKEYISLRGSQLTPDEMDATFNEEGQLLVVERAQAVLK